MSEIFSKKEILGLLEEIHIPSKVRNRMVEYVMEILSIQDTSMGTLGSEEKDQALLMAEDKTWYIPRFEHIPMIYRDYVGIHQRRMSFIIGMIKTQIEKVFGEGFNSHYATIYSSYHDILEGLSPFGDVITPLKMGLSNKSQQIMNTVEEKLGRVLINRLPLSGSFEYDEQSLRDMISKETIESQFVSYVDKLDGFMACFHELVAGNHNFLEPFQNYIKIFQDIKIGKKLPSMQKLFDTSTYGGDIGEDLNSLRDIDSVLEQANRIDDIFGICNTTKKMKENIENDYGFPLYKLWKFATKMSAVNIDIINSRIISGEEMLTKRGRKLRIPEHLQ